MKTILYSSVIAGLALSSPAWAALVPEDKADCESLGYTVDFDECLAQKAMPLLCPFYSVNNKKVACIINSCRGYPLKESDFSQMMSDGQPLSAHIDGTFVPEQTESAAALGCRAGWEKSGGTLKEVWYYKIKKCKDSSRFQNDKCDVGCDKVNKYPYSSHPGDLAGEVDNCVDKDGTWFGYKSCNDGWYLSNGRCELSECEIVNYPYISDPNQDEVRGTTTTCRIGGSVYYRFESCNSGFTLAGGVCAKTCNVNISGCRKNTKTITFEANGKNYQQQYYDWKCDFSTPLCKVGDYAAINDKIVGIIFHLPESENDKTMIVANTSWTGAVFAQGEAASFDTPIAWNGEDGKNNINIIKVVQQAYPSYSYPAFEHCYNYAPSNGSCGIGQDNFCTIGEWFLPNLTEIKQIYVNRYILYNVTNSWLYLSGSKGTSYEGSAISWYLYDWLGGGWGHPKNQGLYIIPITSF